MREGAGFVPAVGEGCAVLLAAHGASENRDSERPAYRHAERLRATGYFEDVRVGFWKQSPHVRDVYEELLQAPGVRRVVVQPFFLAEGYFSQEVIPKALELSERRCVREGREVLYAGGPGAHPALANVLEARARRMARCGGLVPDEASLVLVGHGTSRNAQTGETLEWQLERVRKRGLFGQCVEAFMEMEPLVSRWDELTDTPHVVVVPFFVANGLHAYEDIPVLLGIAERVDLGRPRYEIYSPRGHALRGRRLWYAPSIGAEPLMTDVLLACVQEALKG